MFWELSSLEQYFSGIGTDRVWTTLKEAEGSQERPSLNQINLWAEALSPSECYMRLYSSKQWLILDLSHLL